MRGRGRILAEASARTALLGLLWWVLAEGDVSGWPLALLAVGGAVAGSLAVAPGVRRRLRPGGVLRFIPFFVGQSLEGGLDVARRAFHPALPLEPGFIDHPLGLPPGGARLFFVGTVSLLPGTLSVSLVEEARDEGGIPRLRVHLLDAGSPATTRKLKALEARVADLFGVAEPEGSRGLR